MFDEDNDLAVIALNYNSMQQKWETISWLHRFYSLELVAFYTEEIDANSLTRNSNCYKHKHPYISAD